MGISDWSSDVCSSDLRALEGKAAWMSGLRRAEAATRGQAPIVVRDLRGLVKVNPIATWTDADVEGYIADHDVPVNPLQEQGYRSIGCWPRSEERRVGKECDRTCRFRWWTCN